MASVCKYVDHQSAVAGIRVAGVVDFCTLADSTVPIDFLSACVVFLVALRYDPYLFGVAFAESLGKDGWVGGLVLPQWPLHCYP